jgi:hypothetical protein
MVRSLALALTLLGTACVPQAGQVPANDVGVSGGYTAQFAISDHPHHVLMGHVIDATRDGERIRALVIHQRQDGVHRLVMREAWSQGVQLPYRSTSRRLDGCTHGHCLDNSVGMIFLSNALFSHAEIHGLTARLIGPGDAVDIYAPPEMFQALP